MRVSARVEPIDKDLEVIFREELSPSARSSVLARVAREALVEGDEQNRSVLGRIPPHKTFVDGGEGRSEDDVSPSGTIVYEWEILTDLFLWIADQLKTHSPVGRGRDRHPGLYQKSHTLFADGTEVDIGAQIPEAREYVFMNMLDYARKIEQGESSQASDGVYESIAALARQRFGNVAKISFTYRGIVAGKQINPETIGAARYQSRRNARTGRFAFQGGSRAHNVSSVRFPAIVITVR